MENENCVFCKITSGKLPAFKIYEDKEHVAFLDIMPVAKGQTLVIPKRHMSSKFSDTEDKELSELILVSKKVANIIMEKLPAKRVSLAFEGLDIDHLHAKLYPDHGIMYLGPKASDEELSAVHKKLTQ